MAHQGPAPAAVTPLPVIPVLYYMLTPPSAGALAYVPAVALSSGHCGACYLWNCVAVESHSSFQCSPTLLARPCLRRRQKQPVTLGMGTAELPKAP